MGGLTFQDLMEVTTLDVYVSLDSSVTPRLFRLFLEGHSLKWIDAIPALAEEGLRAKELGRPLDVMVRLAPMSRIEALPRKRVRTLVRAIQFPLLYKWLTSSRQGESLSLLMAAEWGLAVRLGEVIPNAMEPVHPQASPVMPPPLPGVAVDVIGPAAIPQHSFVSAAASSSPSSPEIRSRRRSAVLAMTSFE